MAEGELTNQTTSPGQFGTKSSLKVGDQITLIGAPSKTGAPTVWISKVIGPTGEEIKLGAGE